MYETNDFRKGLKIELDNHPYEIVEFQFVKPGKGNAFTRTKVKSLLNGNVIERTFKTGEKVKPAQVLQTNMQFLYEESGTYHFMDNKSYEQYEIKKEQIGDGWKFIQEGMECNITLYEGSAVSVILPNFSVMEVTYCEPGMKGDTATNTTKPATLSSGAEIQVPLFVNQGEKIKIDTRTATYVERIK